MTTAEHEALRTGDDRGHDGGLVGHGLLIAHRGAVGRRWWAAMKSVRWITGTQAVAVFSGGGCRAHRRGSPVRK